MSAIEGTVRDASGAPVEGAIVYVDETSRATTDARGAYRIDGLAAGTYSATAGGIAIIPERHHPDGDRHRRWFALADGETKADVDIHVRRGGGCITGVVRDRKGAPIAGARVSVARSRSDDIGGERRLHAPTFRLCLEPGMYGISARRGHYDGEVRRTRVEVIAHAVVEIALPVHVHPGTISGIVVDPSGAPIAHAQVWIDHDEPHHANVRTLADGAFVLRDLSPTTHTIVARHDALGASRVVDVVTDGEPLRLTIESFASIAGRVTPVSGPFTIRVGDRFERFDRANGAFALDRIPQGATEVFACDDTGDGILAIALAPGETRRDLALALLPRTAATGRILDRETGAPLANASAMIGGEWVTTDDEARFHVPHVSVGRPIPFSVRRHTWLRVLRVVEPGPEPIDLGDWLV